MTTPEKRRQLAAFSSQLAALSPEQKAQVLLAGKTSRRRLSLGELPDVHELLAAAEQLCAKAPASPASWEARLAAAEQRRAASRLKLHGGRGRHHHAHHHHHSRRRSASPPRRQRSRSPSAVAAAAAAAPAAAPAAAARHQAPPRPSSLLTAGLKDKNSTAPPTTTTTTKPHHPSNHPRDAGARRLQKAWRAFRSTRRTTAELVAAFKATGLDELASAEEQQRQERQEDKAEEEGNGGINSTPGGFFVVGSLSGGSGGDASGSDAAAARHRRFEAFAARLQEPGTLRAAQALLKRYEHWLMARDGAALAAAEAAAATTTTTTPSAATTPTPTRRPPGVAAITIPPPPLSALHLDSPLPSPSPGGAMASSPSTSLLLRQMRAHHAAALSSPAASAAAAAPLQAASAAAVVSPLPVAVVAGSAPSSSCPPLPPGRRPRHVALLQTANSAASNQSGGLGGGGGGSAGPSTPVAAAATAVSSPSSQQQQPPAPTPLPTSRFPVRVFLSAYMMRSHPEVVFSSIGPEEAALAQAATAMLAAFESACAAFSPPSETPASSTPTPARQRLERLDDAWAEYHALFRAWRGRDAAQLEREIVDMACRLEVSMLRKVGAVPGSSGYEARLAMSPDLQSLARQVQGDRQLLRARLARVSGRAGVARMDAALEEARAAVAAEVAEQQAVMAAAAASNNNGSEQQQQQQQRVALAACAFAIAGGAAFLWWRRRAQRSTPRGSPLPRSGSSGALLGGGAAAGASSTPDAANNANPTTNPTTPVPDLANEAMVWEMLYSSGFSLPTTEAEGAWRRAIAAAATAAGEQPPTPSADADAEDNADNAANDERPLTREEADRLSPEQLDAAVQRRARAIAERAFWDSVEWRLRTGAQRGGGLAEQLGPMVCELARDASGLLVGGSSSSSSNSNNQELARALMEKYGASEQRAAAALASAAALSSSSSSSPLPPSVEKLGGASTSALLATLADLSRGLAAAAATTGSGARAEAANSAAADAERRLGAAVASAAQAAEAAASAGRSPAEVEAAVAGALAPALTCALRLLLAQAKLQRIDAANARLAGLCKALRQQAGGAAAAGAGQGDNNANDDDEAAAVAYLRAKLADKWGFAKEGSSAAECLPRTARWLREAQQAMVVVAAAAEEQPASPPASPPASSPDAASPVASICASLAAAGLLQAPIPGLEQQQASAASSMVPATLRAGLKKATGQTASDANDANAANTGSLLRPCYPALPPSWRAALRLALLALVSGDAPASDPTTLPETLLLDRERLHALQNALQRALVLAGGMLVAAQLRAAAGLAAWTPAQADAGRRRLSVVLADPGMRLADVVTDLAALANEGWVGVEAGGAPSSPSSPSSPSASPPVQEARVRALFTSLVNPDSPGFRALRANLCAATACALLHGPQALSKSRDAQLLLSRAGAGALAGEVAELAGRLAAVATVQERVFGGAIEEMVAGDV